MNCDEIIKEYEGKGIPYRGICDDIRYIVSGIVSRLPENNERINNILEESFSVYKLINQIKIKNNSCMIIFNDDVIKEIKFKSYYFDDDYRKMLYTSDELFKAGYKNKDIEKLTGRYRYKGECHSTTLDYLTLFKDKNICAVTSLCVNINNILYFHSYIWDKDNNIIIDLARNIVMYKADYDYLFTYKEINVLNYDEYINFILNVEKHNYNHLLYLALITLYNENLEKKKLVCV